MTPRLLLAITSLLTVLLQLACTAPAPISPAAATPPTAATTAKSASAAPVRGELTVFAAASLADAFTEIGDALGRTNPGLRITYQFAGSSALRTQLRQGARADLFASADEPNMQGAQQDGSISTEPRIFAQNKLVIITPARAEVDVARPQDLAKPGLKLVIGQKDLPAGSYARQILDRMAGDQAYGSDFAAKALANVVSEEANVKQVVAKVQLGEADAGIVYSTDVTASVRPQVKIVEIPSHLNVVASYPIAIVNGSRNTTSAQAFTAYLLSPAGQSVLEKHGFKRADAQP